MKPRLLTAVLLLSLGSSLSAQEPRPPRPDAADMIRMQRGMPPGDGPFEDRQRILASRRARLGISINMRARETDSVGALIQAVSPNGPAARAGLRSGDIITRFNGSALVDETVRTGREQSRPGMALTMLAAGVAPGDTVAIEYRRGKDRKNASVVAGDEPAWTFTQPDGAWGFVMGDNDPDYADGQDAPRHGMTFRIETDTLASRADSFRAKFRDRSHLPPPMMFLMGTPLEDLELAPVNRDLGRYFGVVEGVLVISVPAEFPLGLKAGDVVLSVDGRGVEGPGQLLRILRSYEPGESIRMSVMRMKKRELVVGTLGDR